MISTMKFHTTILPTTIFPKHEILRVFKQGYVKLRVFFLRFSCLPILFLVQPRKYVSEIFFAINTVIRDFALFYWVTTPTIGLYRLICVVRFPNFDWRSRPKRFLVRLPDTRNWADFTFQPRDGTSINLTLFWL